MIPAKKGSLSEILISFVLLTVVMMGVLFIFLIDSETTSLFANLKQKVGETQQAENFLEMLLSCHKTTALEESSLGKECPANTMNAGYKIHQLTINGCEEKDWDYSIGEWSSSLPFILPLKQTDREFTCLVTVEVLFP